MIAFSDHPPAEAVAAVDAFDPDGSALCLLNPVATTDRYLGRESLGGRRPEEIAALEDKTLADGSGMRQGSGERRRWWCRSIAAIAGCGPGRHRPGDGTVWSGDASEGMNGGADRVRLVRAEDETSQPRSSCSRPRPGTSV